MLYNDSFSDISSRYPFTWCSILFVEPLGIDFTKTVDFTLSFKLQPSTCFKMGTRTVRVFFLGTFMDFELFEGSLGGVALFFFVVVVVAVVAVIRYCLQIITPSL